MRNWVALVCVLLSACAATPDRRIQPADTLFRDELFVPPSQPIVAADIFALSEPMQRYLKNEIAGQLRVLGPQHGLISALYQKEQLKLQYDSSMTRNASEAFDARAGNCLSLVIMTAAFAKAVGLQVRFQSAYLEETWNRSGDLLVRSGHVNVTLDRRMSESLGPSTSLTIDFLPQENLRGLRSHQIEEDTIVAMYMNNKAVEALANGRADDAYAWARQAILRDPEFLGSHNTLGVIYMRRGDLAQATKVFSYLLERDPVNARAMSNLAQVLAREGRMAESEVLLQRLAKIEPIGPFHYFNLGMAAMEQQKFREARDLFAKEVARADYQSEFHFWLAVANYKLGDVEPARKHMKQALANSLSRKDQDLYAAKLAWLQTHREQ